MDGSFELDETASLFLSAVLKIGFGLAIFVIITFFVWIYYFRNYVAENIDQYKCKPYIMPIINIFDSEIDTSANFKKCLGTNNQIFFNTVSQPVVNATGSITDSMGKAADAVGMLTNSVMHIGDVMQNKVESSNTELDKLNSIFVYFLMKVKSVFDKVGGLLNDAYGGLQSIMDTVNIVLVLPEMVMQIFGFLVMLFTLIVALLIIMFVVNYVLGISFTALGMALLPIPFTAIIGAIWVAMGGVLIEYIALGIYLVAIIITTIFLGIILSIYIPVKKHFEEADRSSYCCFSSDTPAKLQSGDSMPISSLQLGETLSGGGKVHGILYSKMKSVEPDDWVKVMDSEGKSCLVYKTHKLYQEDHSMVAVGDVNAEKNGVKPSPLTEKDILRLQNREKWCLVTSNHLIESIGGLQFTDYQEHHECSDELVRLASLRLKEVSPLPLEHSIQKEFEYGEMNFGFFGDTLIYLENQLKKICDLRVGDVLEGSNEVLGIYICSSTEIFQPKVIHGVPVPPQQILKCTSTASSTMMKAYMWRNEEEFEYIERKSSTLLYHIVTSSGLFHISTLDKHKLEVLDFVSNGTLID